jgi:hypothetical protein
MREFLDLMYDLDSDRDCSLTKHEFLQFVDKFNLSPSSDYSELVYTAMSNKSHKKISFSNVRTIFEASNNGYLNSTVCRMLFKGVSESVRIYLTFGQFKRMIFAIDPEKSETVIEAIYRKNRNEKLCAIEYKNVAYALFNYRPRLNENPFHHPIKFISPYSQGCRLL